MCVHVVAEVARPHQGQALGGVPSLVGRSGDDPHTLPVPQPLGGDRLPGVVLEHDDQVGGGGEYHPVRLREKVLVLERQLHATEFAFDPKDASAKAGKVTITAPNDGKVVHELVLLKTDEDPAALPKKGDEVDESTSVGEIADVEPGSTKKATFKLAPGKYAMVCALPGHYEGGMYGSLTIE